MKINTETKKKEAIVRMKLWGIHTPIVRKFQDRNLVAESAPPVGACYWLDEAQLERVKAFEKEYNALVYHVIHSLSNIGELENYLYVSDHEEEWEMDREDLKEGQQLAYVDNLSMPDCSEFGSIGVSLTIAAGLCRVW